MQLTGAVVHKQNEICSVQNSAVARRLTPRLLTSVADVKHKSMKTPFADVSSRPTHPRLLDELPQIATAAVQRYFAVLWVAPDLWAGCSDHDGLVCGHLAVRRTTPRER